MAGRVRRLLHAALLVPVLVFAVSTLEFVDFLCSMDGGARGRCCCPADKDGTAQAQVAGETDDHARIGATPCCELRRLSLDRSPTEPPRAPTPQVHLLPVAVANFLALPTDGETSRAPLRFVLPAQPAGPSLLLLKQTFLI